MDWKSYSKNLERNLNQISERLPSGIILDLGCGKGEITALLAQEYMSIGVDLPELVEEQAQTQLNIPRWQIAIWKKLSKTFGSNYVVGHGGFLPFRSSSLDAVIAYASLEHIKDNFGGLSQVLKEMHRILKKHGFLFVFLLPRRLSYSEMLARMVGFGRHERLFSEAEISEELRLNNMQIIRITNSEIIMKFPHSKLQRIWNFFWPILFYVDALLETTPLKYFSHYIQAIALRL